jgi:hypothetical protein
MEKKEKGKRKRKNTIGINRKKRENCRGSAIAVEKKSGCQHFSRKIPPIAQWPHLAAIRTSLLRVKSE